MIVLVVGGSHCYWYCVEVVGKVCYWYVLGMFLLNVSGLWCAVLSTGW